MPRKPLITYTDDSGIKVDLYEKAVGHSEIYADGIQGVMVSGEVVKFNLISDKITVNNDVREREIVATIVMPVNRVSDIAELFAGIFDDMVVPNKLGIKEKPKEKKTKK
ncbi:MAG: hypothetical protein KAJ29_07295 [Alphaproteobacteria bacterium]|nr:hypothetical protein [Alphaproteobacteria bacterium]